MAIVTTGCVRAARSWPAPLAALAARRWEHSGGRGLTNAYRRTRRLERRQFLKRRDHYHQMHGLGETRSRLTPSAGGYGLSAPTSQAPGFRLRHPRATAGSTATAPRAESASVNSLEPWGLRRQGPARPRWPPVVGLSPAATTPACRGYSGVGSRPASPAKTGVYGSAIRDDTAYAGDRRDDRRARSQRHRHGVASASTATATFDTRRCQGRE